MSDPKHDLKTIDQILALPDGGDFLMEVHDKHEALITAMADFVEVNNKSATGSFTIKLTYQLDRTGMFQIAAKCDAKEPQKQAATAVAWQGTAGRITPANPAQMRMEIRDVSPGKAELRTAN
jgi:esterase/lipase